MSFPEAVDEIPDVSEDEGKIWDLTRVWINQGTRGALSTP